MSSPLPLPLRLLPTDEHPYRLSELKTPPAKLYLAGELPDGPCVGIVGTRYPTPRAQKFAHGMARDLAGRGVVVYSGGARGIDTAAHEGALAAGGRTVVVAPSSFDRPFPEQNADLFRSVVERGGGFLTTHASGIAATRAHFFARNRLLAALVDALVIVETRVRGGARNTAKAARELERPVLVVPGAPWNPQALGCLLELQNGARLVTCSDDVLEALAIPHVKERGAARPAGQLSFERFLTGVDPERDSVIAALENGPIDPDRICSLTGLEPHQVQALLLTLTLEGILVSGPSGNVSLVID